MQRYNYVHIYTYYVTLMYILLIKRDTLLKIFISCNTSGYEIAGNFRSHIRVCI
jgi:hypothetical protein